MADESSLVKSLAQKFKLLSRSQVKTVVSNLPPSQQAAGVAAAAAASPENSKKLFDEFPERLAKALKLLLTKGTPLEERSKTQVATAALASAAAYAKNAAGRFGEAAKGLGARAGSSLMDVWRTIRCAFAQLPSLAILKGASDRVPIWSERYGRVNVKLIDKLVEMHGASKAHALLEKISPKSIPRSNWSRKPISDEATATAKEAFERVKAAGGTAAQAARAARNVAFNRLVKTGVSASRAAEMARTVLKSNRTRSNWTRTPISNAAVTKARESAREAFERVKKAGGSVVEAATAARKAAREAFNKAGISAGEAATAAKAILKMNKNRVTWSRKPISNAAVTKAREAAREAFERVKKAGGSVAEATRAALAASRAQIKKSPFNISGIMGAFSNIARMARTATSKSAVRKQLNQFEAKGVSAPWVQAIRLRLNRARTPEEISQISKNFANKVEGFATGNISGAMIPPVAQAPPLGPAPAPPPPINKWLEDSKNMNRKSIQNLVKLRRNYPTRKSDINRALGEKVEKLISNSGRSGTSSIKEILRLMKSVPNLPGKDRVFDLIEQRIQDIEYDARNNPVTAKERLRRFKSSIGYSGGLFGNRNLGRIFSNAEREYNRKIADNRRRKMNENRNRRGLAPLPANNRRPNNYAAPRGNMGGVFRPPPNQPVPNLRAPNMGPPMNMGPPLNMGEIKAINNVGGPNKALNLVQNAGGSNEVLRAANQLKEAGGSPELAVAKGANVKNIKIVLQLGGANNAAKVATAAPKLRKRRRSKKTKKAKGKGRPKVSAIKKLLRSLPKKKLLAVLPKSNKASMANKNKANVATRVTSYLAGRTKKK